MGGSTMQQEIVRSGKLLDDKGMLAQKGYAKSLLMDYDRGDIRAGKLRIKEWDYYLVTCDDFALALTLDDNSYMGMVSASFLDFRNKCEKTSSVILPLTRGRIGMPSSSAVGDCEFKNDRVSISFVHTEQGRHLHIHYKKFDGTSSLRADIDLTEEPCDSMVIATPFQENPKAFYYNQKIVGMKASGQVKYNGQWYTFEPGNAFGLLDWGRGVWTYDNTWYWSAGQGMAEGKVFGFNLGYGFGDTRCASENMLFYDGVASKLEQVTFHIPQSIQGKDDYLSPWTFSSSDRRFEMAFTPILDRSAKLSLGILCSDQHQVFGRFTGKAVLDDGREIEIKDFLGFAEKVRNKW